MTEAHTEFVRRLDEKVSSEQLWRSNAVLQGLPRINLDYNEIPPLTTYVRLRTQPRNFEKPREEREAFEVLVADGQVILFELEDTLHKVLINQIHAAPSEYVKWGEFPAGTRLGIANHKTWNEMWSLFFPAATDAWLARQGFTNLVIPDVTLFPIAVDSLLNDDRIYLFGERCRVVTADLQIPSHLLHWSGQLELPDLYWTKLPDAD